MNAIPKADLSRETVRNIKLLADKHKSQLDRFKEAARELGTDDDEERFNERLKKLVKQKPKEDSDD